MATQAHKADARWARTRQRLLDGGRQAFAESGVEAATVLDIVRAAGVSQPSFYNHFESKDALAREIVADFFRRDGQIKAAVFEQVDDPAEAIAINIGHTLSMATADPVIALTLVKSEALRELVMSSRDDLLVDMIDVGVRKGRFDTHHPQTLALVIRGAALTVLQGILDGSADPDAAQCFQELVLRMLGLTPAQSARVVARAQQWRQPDLGAVA